MNKKLRFYPRYATRGIMNALPMDLQLVLWSMIEQKQKANQELDYLQIFELAVTTQSGRRCQQIVHRQEVPPASNTIVLAGVEEPISIKVWIIDDGDYATMLLPGEY